MSSDDPRLQDVRDRFATSAFHTEWVGMRLERVEPGEVDVALEVQAHHVNLVGTVHGGLIATLADTATGLAYRTVLEPGTLLVTSALNVTFLAPARSGTVTAKGRVVKSGKRMGYTEADVVDAEGNLLARATATLMLIPDRGVVQ